jgi:cell division protease FtsH
VSNRSQEPKKPDPGLPKLPFNNRVALITLLALIALFVVLVVYNNERGFAREIAYSVFLTYVDRHEVAEVKIVDGFEILGQFSDNQEQFKTTIPYHDPQLLNRLESNGVRITGGPKPVSPFRIFIEFLPWVLGIFFICSCFARCRAPETAPSPSARAAPSATWTPARRSLSPMSPARTRPSTSSRKW